MQFNKVVYCIPMPLINCFREAIQVHVLWNSEMCGRYRGPMVCVLESRSSCMDSSPGQGHCVVTLYSQCLSPPRCIPKWVPANWMLCDALAPHPGRSRNISGHFMLWKLAFRATTLKRRLYPSPFSGVCTLFPLEFPMTFLGRGMNISWKFRTIQFF